VNTQAAVSAKTATAQSGNASDPPNGAQNSTGKMTEPDKELTTGSTKQRPIALQIVARGIKNIIADDKPERKIKAALEGILKFIRDEEEKEKKTAEGVLAQPVVSTLHKVIKQELSKVYEALAKQMDGVLGTASVTLENTEKTLADTQNLKEITKEISSKVGKVNNAADKIVSDMQTYQDVLAQSPAVASKFAIDPKVLGDMECRAR
jgi:hypothetical protein